MTTMVTIIITGKSFFHTEQTGIFSLMPCNLILEFATKAFRNVIRSSTDEPLAPIIIPICWLRKNRLIAVGRNGLSTAAESATNCEELSRPTPTLAGKMYIDSQMEIRPCQRSMMARKLATHILDAVIEETL